MLSSRSTRLLGPYEYEIFYPVIGKQVPGKRRSHILQTNLNTTIQEILVEVCNLQEFNPKDHEIIFEGKKLERSLTIRKSGLPIHGVLDLVASASIEQATTVNVALQLENGKRLANKFNVEEALWAVLQHWEAQGEAVLTNSLADGSNAIPVCNYLRQTIVGREELEKTSLRSIGLTRGSGIVRLNFRSPDEIGQQAAVSSSKAYVGNTASVVSQVAVVSSQQPNERSSSSTAENSNVVKAELIIKQDDQEVPKMDAAKAGSLIETTKYVSSTPPSDVSKSETKEQIITVSGESNEVKMDVDQEDIMEQNRVSLKFAEIGRYEILGENEAVLYHGDDVSAPKQVSVPDDFFDITFKDVESIYKDLRAKRTELEEAPLLTSTLRSTSKQEFEERILSEHPVTVVRIRFPDRFVLQGVFSTSDTISAIYLFARRYLCHPDLPFYLFVAPPKRILDQDKTLIEEQLHGLAIVYFGSETQQEAYLSESLYERASDPEEVFKNSGKSSNSSMVKRSTSTVITATTDRSRESQPTKQSLPPPKPTPEPQQGPSVGPSSAGARHGGNSGVVPKWFKLSK